MTQDQMLECSILYKENENMYVISYIIQNVANCLFDYNHLNCTKF